MQSNVGGIERPIRIALGSVLVGVGAFAELPTAAMAAALVVGGVALGTGLIGYCPAWTLLGINTCPAKQPDRPH